MHNYTHIQSMYKNIIGLISIHATHSFSYQASFTIPVCNGSKLYWNEILQQDKDVTWYRVCFILYKCSGCNLLLLTFTLNGAPLVGQ